MSAPQPQTEIFLGRQPILDPRRRIVGYELLFRSGRDLTANVTDDVLATSAVITQAMGSFGIGAALGRHSGFINVSRELLMNDVLELLPRQRIVLELLETTKIDDNVIERCRDLKARGFRLALDDFEYNSAYDPLIEIVDIIKFDIALSTSREIDKVLQRIKKRAGIQLLAEKVENVDQFEAYRERGFHLFQGYFFARPTILSGKKVTSNQTALLRLLSQVMGNDEISQIETTLKESPDLILGLLRLVNSAGMGLRIKIGSVQQALVLLGRQQLQRWVQLLLYAQGGSGSSNPLLQLAATRARTMELLNQSHRIQSHNAKADYAFIVGILSLADVVLGLKIDGVIGQINLIDEVKEAILKHEGFFGHMLTLVQKVEAGEFRDAAQLLTELEITPAELSHAQLEAMRWAASLSERSN